MDNVKNDNFIVNIGRAFKSLKWYEIAMCIIMLGISIYYAILPQEGTPQWLAIINFVSGLCGIICVFFCAKANRMNFPFAVVNTTVFMIYLAYFGIWATFWLEAIVYFPALSFWAGNTWMKFADQFGWNVGIMKWLDSAIFAIGVVAVVLEMLRYTEQYVWWLVTDVIAVAQYALKKDPVYTTKKTIYLIEAIVGIKNWGNLAKKNKENE